MEYYYSDSPQVSFDMYRESGGSEADGSNPDGLEQLSSSANYEDVSDVCNSFTSSGNYEDPGDAITRSGNYEDASSSSADVRGGGNYEDASESLKASGNYYDENVVAGGGGAHALGDSGQSAYEEVGDLSDSQRVDISGSGIYEDASDTISLSGSSNYVDPSMSAPVKPASKLVKSRAQAAPPPPNSNHAAVDSINYNAKYLELVERFLANPELESAEQQVVLAEAFVLEAVHVAQRIVEEQGMHISNRTIKPLDNAGGVAGGVKFIVKNIFYKVAVDEHGIYGDDQVAGKVASREILSTNFLMEAATYSSLPIHFPLMCAVQFRGRTILASSILPLGKGTLIYGSEDGGKTVQNSDIGFSNMVARVAQRLNLKEHACGPARTMVHLAADVEGHMGKDGRYYLIDTARTFPAEAPRRDLMEIKSGHLFRLLRPELVQQCSEPLSSDVYSGFQKFDPKASQNNKSATDATLYLREKVAPSFFARLQRRRKDVVHWSRDMHLFGLNIRHLGLLHALAVGARDELLERQISKEIFLRCVKNAARIQHRNLEMSELRTEKVMLRIHRLAARDFGVEHVRFDPAMASEAEFSHRTSIETPRVKNLFALTFNVAYILVENTRSSLSLEDARRAVEWYKQCLENFATVELLQNFGVAMLELVRKVEMSNINQAERTPEIADLLDKAEDALETALDVRAAYGQENTLSFAETALNFAAVARFQRNYEAMRERIALCLGSTACSPLIKANAAFFMARYAYDTGQHDVLVEQKNILKKICESGEAEKNNPVAIYDCGVVCTWLNETEEALEMFRISAKYDSVRAGALYMIAISEFDRDELDKCMDACNECLAFDATFQKAQLIYCKALLRKGSPDPEIRLEDLKEVVAKLGSLDSEIFQDVHFLQAQAFRELFKLSRHPHMADLALMCFREAVVKGRRDAYTLVMRGMSAMDMALCGLFRCDVCGKEILGERFRCGTCTDYDICDVCFKKSGHEHETQMHTFRNQPLVDECHDSVLEALRSIDPGVHTLLDGLHSENPQVRAQAFSTMQNLCIFAGYEHMAEHVANELMKNQQ